MWNALKIITNIKGLSDLCALISEWKNFCEDLLLSFQNLKHQHVATGQYTVRITAKKKN